MARFTVWTAALCCLLVGCAPSGLEFASDAGEARDASSDALHDSPSDSADSSAATDSAATADADPLSVPVLLLVRDQEDSTTEELARELTVHGVAFERLTAAEFTVTAPASPSVMLAGFSATPVEWQGAATTRVASAVDSGSAWIGFGFAGYLLNWGGVDALEEDGWGPGCLDAFYFVKAATLTSVFNGVPVWEDPVEPNVPAHLLYRVVALGPRYGMNRVGEWDGPSSQWIQGETFWMLDDRGGCGGISEDDTNTLYCQQWGEGKCTNDRSVHSVSHTVSLLYGAGRFTYRTGLKPHVPDLTVWGDAMGWLNVATLNQERAWVANAAR